MIQKGQKINDRYQIVKSIGEGGMANVYLAYDTILDRNVAVKVLRGDLASDEKFVRRFQREALSASSLSHPNIVEVYDVGEDNGQYYIVMEYIDGKQLKQLLKKRGKLTLTEVIDIMSQISDGLSVAHDAYIIHRDIKPQNIMILENGLIKITDFGIAMAMNSTQLTQTNSVMGSVHYLPPEQANGKGSTFQSDIYSMGILMYELLTGELPYKGENAVEIALKHLKEPFPSIREILPDIPQSVENIIIKATAKNPKNRYENARAMNADLRTCLDEDRKNEARIKLPYPEFEDATKKAPKKEENKPEKEEKIAKEVNLNEEDKKSNKFIKILIGIIAGILAVFAIIMGTLAITDSFNTDVKVPDVTGMTVTEAIETLQNAGFNVVDEQKEISSDTVEVGNIVKTVPAASTKKAKGSSITLYISTGDETIVIEDYTGENAYQIEGKLEAFGIIVSVDKKNVEETYSDPYTIIDQSVKAGEKLSKDDQIILYIPNVVVKYPNFVGTSYTKDSIQEFCDTNQITCTFVTQMENCSAGEIISQNYVEGYTVSAGQKLKVTICESAEEEQTCNPLVEECE